MVDLSQLRPIKSLEDLEAENASINAIAYLRSTDWYIIRQVETGQPVPEDILGFRAAARGRVLVKSPVAPNA